MNKWLICYDVETGCLTTILHLQKDHDTAIASLILDMIAFLPYLDRVQYGKGRQYRYLSSIHRRRVANKGLEHQFDIHF